MVSHPWPSSAEPFSPRDTSMLSLSSPVYARSFLSQMSPAFQKCLQYAHGLVSFAAQYQAGKTDQDTYSFDNVRALEHIPLSLPYGGGLSTDAMSVSDSPCFYIPTLASGKPPLYFAWIISLVMALKAALLSLLAVCGSGTTEIVPLDLSTWPTCR